METGDAFLLSLILLFCMFRTQKAVWHGTKHWGSQSPNQDCQDWRTASSQASGLASLPTGSKFLAEDTSSCSDSLMVLCVEIAFSYLHMWWLQHLVHKEHQKDLVVVKRGLGRTIGRCATEMESTAPFSLDHPGKGSMWGNRMVHCPYHSRLLRNDTSYQLDAKDASCPSHSHRI